jgi:hypothetical protein
MTAIGRLESVSKLYPVTAIAALRSDSRRCQFQADSGRSYAKVSGGS